MLSFKEFVKAQSPQNLHLNVLAFDPGETVGWVYMEECNVTEAGQIITKDFSAAQMQALEDKIKLHEPDVIVYESYQIYSWKTDTHAWSEVHTAQIIGVIKYLATRYNIPIVSQTAQIAKQFVTDDKLDAWKFWAKGARHANDAIRHGCYYLIFGAPKT